MHKHTDIWDILQAFPADYRSGEQQDILLLTWAIVRQAVTKIIRFFFDNLGGSNQSLLREGFAGELQEKIQCRECSKFKVREETFTDLVLPVPTAEQAKGSGIVPAIKKLLQKCLKCMADAQNLVTCEKCQKKTCAGNWRKISRPLLRCLGNFAPLHRTHHIFACAWNLGISKHGMSAVKWSKLFHLHYGNHWKPMTSPRRRYRWR